MDTVHKRTDRLNGAFNHINIAPPQRALQDQGFKKKIPKFIIHNVLSKSRQRKCMYKRIEEIETKSIGRFRTVTIKSERVSDPVCVWDDGQKVREALASTLDEDGASSVGDWAASIILVIGGVLEIVKHFAAVLLFDYTLHLVTTLFLLALVFCIFGNKVLDKLNKIGHLIVGRADSKRRTICNCIVFCSVALQELFALLDLGSRKARIVELGDFLPVVTGKSTT